MNESTAKRSLLAPLATAFAASGAIMVIELCAGRLISRYLGMSLYTWTSTIAVIMAGMAVGNAAGGEIADRHPAKRALAVLFALAALMSAAALPVNTFLGSLQALAALDWPARIGLHVFGLFFLPAVVLGAIAPVVARFALGLGGPQGRTVGLVYASSVAGSIFCTFLTGFYLVSMLRVSQVFLTASGALLALAAVYAVWSLLGNDPAPERSEASITAGDAQPGPWWTAILTVITSNFAFMAIELGAGRALSRDYGNSVYTWTATIGVFLAGITLGNAAGGSVADRGASRAKLAKYFLAASIAALFGPLCFRLMHEQLLKMHNIGSGAWAFKVTTTLAAGYFLPSFFIGFISPLVVKRGLDAGRLAGNTVASVYAWGSLGGVVGTLLTGYFLIDWMGSIAVVAWAGLLLGLAAVAYGAPRPVYLGWGVVALLMALISVADLGPSKAIANVLALRPKELDNTVYQDESQYSFIAIHADPDHPRVRSMILDKLEHSVIDFDDPSAFKQDYETIYQAIFEKLFPKKQPVRSFFIGGGGFIFPRYFDTARPGGHTEVAEIDPAVTKAAIEAFGLNPQNGLKIANMDARNRLTTVARQHREDPAGTPPFDIIVGDSFNDFSVPSHLTTLEFTRDVKDLLTEKGIYVLNMIDMYEPGNFLSSFYRTLHEVFPYVYVFDCGAPPNIRDTFVILCAQQPCDIGGIPAQLRAERNFAGHLITRAGIENLLARNKDQLLIDDYAPTELLLLPVVSRWAADVGQEHYVYAIQARAKGYTDKAIEECDLALDGHPDWSDVEELRAELYLEKNQPEIAIAAYRAALKFTVDPIRVHAKLGACLIEHGKADEGVKELEAALAKAPEHFDALLTLGSYHMEQKRYPEALELLERAVKADPNSVNARFNLGFVYSQLKDYPNAISQWESAFTIEPNNTDCLDNLLATHIITKDYDKAIEVAGRYEKLSKTPPAKLMELLHSASGK